MDTFTIGEAAERSGFSTSALRYYEGIGLVEPTRRTDAGYRLYDEESLTRLRFIARAKQLGCSLDEIIDLVGIWDGERCGPVQQRFHRLVSDKITGARRQIEELTAVSGELQAVATQLSGPATDGACGPDCACLAESPSPSDGPIACTLGADDLPGRLDDWRTILTHATERTRTGDGVHISFDRTVDVVELAKLVEAEQGCCAFYTFALVVGPDRVALDVHAPEGAEAMVDALFEVTA